MDSETLLVADVGKIEDHRHAEELVAPLADDGTSPGDDGLGEVVVKGHAGVAERHRRFAIDNERGQGGDQRELVLVFFLLASLQHLCLPLHTVGIHLHWPETDCRAPTSYSSGRRHWA